MENYHSIEEIVEKVSVNYDNRSGIERYKLLLGDSGVKKENISEFFMYPEGESFEIGISLHELREKLRDTNFFIRFTSNLFELLDSGSKQELFYTLKKDGYSFDEDNKLDKVVFRLNYNVVDHVVSVNDLVISSPDFSSENDQVMDYLFNHPNKEIRIVDEEIICEEGEKIPLKKTPSKIINHLGFKNLASRIFFPGISSKMIQLRNPITLSELRKRGYDENLTLEDIFPNKTNNGQ